MNVTRELALVTYFVMGLFFATYQDAWQRWCEKPWPFVGYVVLGAAWPLWMTYVGWEITTSDGTFKCPAGPFYSHHKEF